MVTITKNKQGHLDAFDPKSTAPKGKRKRLYTQGLLDRIFAYRINHHRIGMKFLPVLLKAEGFGVTEPYISMSVQHNSSPSVAWDALSTAYIVSTLSKRESQKYWMSRVA